MIVVVKPIERKKWHGKTEADNFSQPLQIEALYDTKTGRYATGLDEKTRKRLEKTTGFDLSDDYSVDSPHPFWSSNTARVKLPYNTVFFDTSKPLDEIKVNILKASKYVANSMEEYEQGLYPEATHVIFDEEEQIKKKATKVQLKNKAIGLSLKLSKSKKIEIVMIMRNKNVKNQTQDYIDVIINELIDENAEKFIRYAEMDDKERYIRGILLEAIQRNILTKEGSAIFYLDDKIAMDFESAVDYFLDPNNQQMKALIIEKLED